MRCSRLRFCLHGRSARGLERLFGDRARRLLLRSRGDAKVALRTLANVLRARADELLEDPLVDVREALHIEAALALGVLSEARKPILFPFSAAEHVKDERRAARGKAGEAHVALAAALIDIVVLPKAHDGRPPHHGRLSGRSLEERDQRLGVGAARRVANAGEKRLRGDLRRTRLGLCHGASLVGFLLRRLLFARASSSAFRRFGPSASTSRRDTSAGPTALRLP